MTDSNSTDARRQLAVAAVLVGTLVGTIALATGPLPATVPGPTGDSTPAAPANATGQLQQLHADGVTGENVTVAVLDPTGFDPDHPALTGRVAATRSFADGEGIRNGGANDHGTAAAALVARTAPAAELYLASFDTAAEFRSAVAWLVRQDVDVVVAPVGFYGKRGDGSSAVARVAASAAEHGTVFVAPAGNLGESHWWGGFDPDEDGTHRFRGGTRNYLLGDDRTVRLWLSWADPDASFSLELHRTNGNASRLVARSEPFTADDAPNARIVADVDPHGTHYFVVRGSAASNGTRIRVSSPSHAFQYRRRGGSVVAPATVDDVVAVGAYDEAAGRVATFSSAGPVGEGRPGVDVVAPGRHHVGGQPEAFVGSSAAAAYVAGVAALVLDANPALDPGAVEGSLRTTATDAGPPGTDAIAGAGRVHPQRAVERARNATQSAP